MKLSYKTFYTLNKTLLRKNGCFSNLYYLVAAQTSIILIHHRFLNTVIQDTFGILPLTLQYLCDLQDAMPLHLSSSTSHPTFPREAEGFLRGGNYPKDMPLPTVLGYLQPV